MNVTALLIDAQQANKRMNALYRDAKAWLIAGHRLIITIKPETRSSAQNARMWILLNALSKQVDWHGQKLTAAEWKDACTAALKQQRVIPGLNGSGFVVLGSSTSAMSRAEMVELQDFIEAFGAQHGVDFGEVLAAEPA